MPRAPREKRSALAKAIRTFRAALGDTQQEFAVRVGLAVTTIARYETNSPPSADVLAKLAELARNSELPLFAKIFEEKLEPQERVDVEEFSALKVVLKWAIENLEPSALRRARIALAVLRSYSDETYERLEEELDRALAMVDEEISKVAGAILRTQNPEIHEKYLHYLHSQNLDSAIAFAKASAPNRKAAEDRETALSIMSGEFVRGYIEDLKCKADIEAYTQAHFDGKVRFEERTEKARS